MDWGETMNSDGKSGPIREEKCHRRDRSSPELPPSVFFLPFWWEIHLGVFLWGFFIPFWGPSLSFLCPGFQKYILPSFILKILFRVISCLMFNVQNGRKFLLGMQTFWFETVWPERKRDIYWFSRGMGILYSTSNSNQWSSQNTGNLREMLVWKRNQTLCLNYVTPFSC